ncbi:MAG: hypothetical protein LBQ68_02095 [Clostridiales bacterium]|jgi:hypothetical protein|nr:hypothetical protein [Clostridiales bacterium]
MNEDTNVQETLRYINDKLEHNKRRQSSEIPKDERLQKIIRDFELKTEVVYKSPPSPRIYQAEGKYADPLYFETKLTKGIVAFNLILTVIVPPVGLIRSIFFLIKKETGIRNLGILMLVVSLILLALWAVGIYAVRNFL